MAGDAVAVQMCRCCRVGVVVRWPDRFFVVVVFAPVVPVLPPLGLEAASWSWPSLPHSSKLEY